jgi:hypothetical protein
MINRNSKLYINYPDIIYQIRKDKLKSLKID